MNKTTVDLIEKLIELIIEANNRGLGDDALVEAIQDMKQRQVAIEELIKYLQGL